MVATVTCSHTLSAKVRHGLARVRDAWHGLGQHTRRAFSQAGGEAQPEAHTCDTALILTDAELGVCPLGLLCRDFVVPNLAHPCPGPPSMHCITRIVVLHGGGQHTQRWATTRARTRNTMVSARAYE